MALRFFLGIVFFSIGLSQAFSQGDTTIPKVLTDSINQAAKASKPAEPENKKAEDTTKWSPAKKAAVYSAILPGLGQIYNRKYWKLPLVYGALAIPAYTFSYNLTWFNRSRLAYNYVYKLNRPPYTADPAVLARIHPKLLGAVVRKDENALKQFRDGSRKYVDYSALIFILLWGLNVVDATVDGHLKDFNITDDLSLHIKSGYMPVGNTNGIGIVIGIGKNYAVPGR